MIVTYDDDDRFNVGDGPVSMGEFEKRLAGILEPGGAGTVEWSNYSSRPRNTSVFTLSAEAS